MYSKLLQTSRHIQEDCTEINIKIQVRLKEVAKSVTLMMVLVQVCGDRDHVVQLVSGRCVGGGQSG